MFKSISYLAAIALIFNLFACKNDEPKVTAEPLQEASTTVTTETTGGGNSTASISKEKITLKDNSEIVFPKEGDTASMVFYFATPGESQDGKTALSEKGRSQSQMMTATMARAGLAIVYIDGNAALQTATTVASANVAELNFFKPANAEETLKLLAKNYKGKKVMVCATSPVLAQMIAQLTGKAAPSIPTVAENTLYVVVSNGIGSGEVKTVNY